MPGPGMELIGEEEKREVLEVLESGYFFRYGRADDPAFKAKVHKLEQAVAQIAGVNYGVAVNSGTTALLVALGGLGVGPGDEVIVPGYTFIASLSSIIYARAVPILAEVDRTLNLDPADVRRKITERTRAIMVVHMLGNPARLDELKSIATEHNLLLIEDCAQACGARYKGRRVGSIGQAGTYSFKICEAIPPERVDAFVRDLKASFRVASEVTDTGLAKSARVSLGLADLVEKRNLDAVAIEDVSEELHRVLGLRPCLYVPALFERAVVSMEAEVGGAVALLMLKKLSRKAPMYTEIFTFDEVENCLLVGHAGIHDINLAESKDDILIEPDGEYVESERDSCWMRFRAKAGQVTLLSLFCDVDRFKMVISSGACLGGKEKLLGPPHAYLKLTTPLAEFFEKAVKTGMTQHWAVVHGDVVNELVALADILGVDRVLI